KILHKQTTKSSKLTYRKTKKSKLTALTSRVTKNSQAESSNDTSKESDHANGHAFSVPENSRTKNTKKLKKNLSPNCRTKVTATLRSYATRYTATTTMKLP